MNRVENIRSLLKNSITISKEKLTRYCKTGPGDYAEHDQFIGVRVPALRSIAKENADLSLREIQTLIKSPINEERQLALFILVHQYQKASQTEKEKYYRFYLKNIDSVNNWNLVDSSAHLIIGAHLFEKDKTVLIQLVQSKNMWERRIAIIATLYFIRKNKLEWTFNIAKILLNDSHDLIHKAVGWMLREVGKKSQDMLINFLKQHAHQMPRTMLRYSIEKFPEQQRKIFLKNE